MRWFPSQRRDGCGYVVLTCVFSCIFLVINAALVNSFCAWLEVRNPRLFGKGYLTVDPGAVATHAVLVVLPVLMVFAEWWLFDVVVSTCQRFTSRGR
jgi:hypothetical protein